jgi:thymidylate synthase
MKEIIAKNTGQAWLESCRIILEEGKIMKDEDENLREVTHMFVEIKNPEENDKIIDKYGDKRAIEWMLSNFFEQKNISELNDSQSYGIRLFNYEGKNQIQWVIDKLKEKPESKSATITTLMPNRDKGYIPCVSLLDFKIRDRKLILTVFCRSIDFGAKAYANMIALVKIQDMVSKQLDVKRGQMILHIVSAHIYEKDFDSIKSVLSNSISEVNKK